VNQLLKDTSVGHTQPRLKTDSLRFSPGDGVLLIGHGTRDANGTAQFFDLGKKLAKRLQPVPVESCLLELQSPTIAEGWQRLVHRGVHQILASPLLLFSAGHAKSDIPDALNRCLETSGGMSWQESRALSRAPELLRLVLLRLDDSLNQSTGTKASTAVVMVGRGSFDPCAQADMKLLTHWVAGQRSAAMFTTAFYAMANPKLPDVLRHVAANNSIRTIVVQPHLLFEGNLYQSIVSQVNEIEREFPAKQFIVSAYLGPEVEVADALIRRLGQQLTNRQRYSI